MKFVLVTCVFFITLTLQAQHFLSASLKPYSIPIENKYGIQSSGAKLYQRNHGMLVGLQRGKYTTIEFGGEIHWRKISLNKPRILATTANMEYNFADNIIGYKAGVWFKRGRINLTYGANLVYFTDFDKNKYGIGPSIGFRLLGFHLVNGYNFLTGDKELEKVNTLYIALRYYFPLDNAFRWEKKNKDGDNKREKKRKEKAKNKKKREKEKRKKNKQKERERNRDDNKKKLFG